MLTGYNDDMLWYLDYDSDTTDSSQAAKLYFVLDASGNPIEVSYRPEGSTTTKFYYYVQNLQGDVIALVDSANGNTVVTYTYDAWGNVLSTNGSLATTLGVLNPFRYRGYVYDSETKLYYLQSRYYDPNLGRFLNPDAFASTGQGILGNNMFAYCNNNPVCLADSGGSRSQTCIDNEQNLMSMPWSDGNIGGKSAYSLIISPPNPNPWITKIVMDYVTNTDEAVVLKAEHFAFYKGVPVIKVPSMGTSGLSVGIIFLGSQVDSPRIVQHEYGHTVQLSQLGLIDYLLLVGAPSKYYFDKTVQKEYSWSVYYDWPWEMIADYYGQVDRAYSADVQNIASLYWLCVRICSAVT